MLSLISELLFLIKIYFRETAGRIFCRFLCKRLLFNSLQGIFGLENTLVLILSKVRFFNLKRKEFYTHFAQKNVCKMFGKKTCFKAKNFQVPDNFCI